MAWPDGRGRAYMNGRQASGRAGGHERTCWYRRARWRRRADRWWPNDRPDGSSSPQPARLPAFCTFNGIGSRRRGRLIVGWPAGRPGFVDGKHLYISDVESWSIFCYLLLSFWGQAICPLLPSCWSTVLEHAAKMENWSEGNGKKMKWKTSESNSRTWASSAAGEPNVHQFCCGVGSRYRSSNQWRRPYMAAAAAAWQYMTWWLLASFCVDDRQYNGRYILAYSWPIFASTPVDRYKGDVQIWWGTSLVSRSAGLVS